MWCVEVCGGLFGLLVVSFRDSNFTWYFYVMFSVCEPKLGCFEGDDRVERTLGGGEHSNGWPSGRSGALRSDLLAFCVFLTWILW